MREFYTSEPVYIHAKRLERDRNIRYSRPAINIDNKFGWCCYDTNGEFPSLQIARILFSDLSEIKERFIKWLKENFSLEELKEILKRDIYNWFYFYTGDNKVWFLGYILDEMIDQDVKLYFDIYDEEFEQIMDYIDYDKIKDYTNFFKFCEEEGVIDNIKDKIDSIRDYEDLIGFITSKIDYEDFYELFLTHAWKYIDTEKILSKT